MIYHSQVSELFDGMEVCGLSIVVGKDGKEHILSACDSTLTLMGDTQEDDRRQIADLVVTRMQVKRKVKFSCHVTNLKFVIIKFLVLNFICTFYLNLIIRMSADRRWQEVNQVNAHQFLRREAVHLKRMLQPFHQPQATHVARQLAALHRQFRSAQHPVPVRSVGMVV